MNLDYQRKVILASQTSSNFVRQHTYSFRGAIEQPVIAPTLLVVQPPNSQVEQSQSQNFRNERNEDQAGDNNLPNDEPEFIEADEVIPEQIVDEQVAEEDEDEREEIRIGEEEYQDLSMHEILGQDPQFFFDAIPRSEIENKIREIVYPRVVILVSLLIRI